MLKETSFTKKILYTLPLIFIIFGANYLLNIILAKMLSPTYYGDFAVVKCIILIASYIFLFGKHFTVVKILPEYIEKKDWKKAHGFLLRDFKILAIFGGALLAVGVLIPIALIPFLHHTFGKLECIHPAFYAIWIIPLFGFSCYLSNLLKSLRQPFLSKVSFPLLNPILVMLLFVILFLLLGKASLYQVFYVYGFALLVVVVLQLIACHQNLPRKIFSSIPEFDVTHWKSVSTHSFIAYFVLLISFNSELIVLEAFGKNEAFVGIFAAILTIATIYVLLLYTVASMMTPVTEKYLSMQDSNLKLKQLLRSSTLLLFFLTLAVTFILYHFRHELLRQFGAVYEKETLSFMIVIFGYAFSTILNLPWFFFEASGQQNELIFPTGVMVVFNIFSTAILVHFFDILGAAIGLAASRIILVIWQNLLLKRSTGVDHFFSV